MSFDENPRDFDLHNECALEIHTLQSQLDAAHAHIQKLQTTNGDLTDRLDAARKRVEELEIALKAIS